MFNLLIIQFNFVGYLDAKKLSNAMPSKNYRPEGMPMRQNVRHKRIVKYKFGLFFVAIRLKNKIIYVLLLSQKTIKEIVMNQELKIIATITILKEEYKEDVEKALYAVVDGTHTEEGNISYELHQDIQNPLVYVFVEVWKSQAAIDSHNQSAHFLSFVKAIDGKVGLSINVVKKVY